MTGPYSALACVVEDANGEPVCRCYRNTDAVRLAADLNLADAVIAALASRPAGKRVVRFDLNPVEMPPPTVPLDWGSKS